MAREFLRRNGRVIAFGTGAFAYAGIMVALGVLLFTYTLSVTHVMVGKYEEQFFKLQGQHVLASREKVAAHNILKNIPSPWHVKDYDDMQEAPFSHISRHLMATESETQQKADEAAGKAIIEFKQSIPRYNFHGQRVNNTFAPTDVNYYESLIVMAIPCFAIALVSCLAGCCFFIGRNCCNLCGGKDPKPEGYTVKERYIPKQLLLALGLITILGSIFGWIGNSNFSQGLTDFFNVIINTTQTLINGAGDIITKLRQLKSVNATSIESSITSLQNGVAAVQSTAENAQSVVQKYDKARQTVINVGYVLASVTALAGMIGSILNKGILCMLMGLAGFASLTFLWLSFGVHLPTSILLADFCVAIDTLTAGNATAFNSSGTFGLDTVLKCLQSADYSPALNLSYAGVDQALNKVNNFTLQFLNVSFTVNNISLLNTSALPSPYNTQLANQVDDINTFMAIIQELSQFANCSFVRKAFQDMQFSLCVTMLKGTDDIMGTQGLLGAIFIPGVYLAIVAWKRIEHPKKRRKNSRSSRTSKPAETHEMENYENPRNSRPPAQRPPSELRDSVPPPPPPDENPSDDEEEEVPPPYPGPQQPSAPPPY